MLQRLSRGETSALEELYIAFAAKIRAFLTTYVDGEAARDMTHDIFLKIWKSRRKFFDGDNCRVTNLDSYMFSIAKNTVLDYYKHHKIEQKYSEAFISSNNEEQDTSPEDRMDSRNRIVVIQKRIGRMSKQQRQVFLMHRNEGMTYSEIAKELGISEKTVQYHISAVLHKIRNAS